SGLDGINAATRREAEGRRGLLNVVDRAQLCDWIAPAGGRRGAPQGALSPSRGSPLPASSPRRRPGQDPGGEGGALVRLLGQLRRRLREQEAPLQRQEAVYAELLRSDVRHLLRDGNEQAAMAVAEQIMREPGRGRVWLVGAGPGGVDLLTLAGR